MINFLVKKYIKNYNDVQDATVRESYGTLCSIVSIICNLILCAFKFVIGFISHSVSIQADAFNNLSDAGSNIATYFGFKLSTKHPDQDHPYGHGRAEYITGLMISFLIFLVAFSSFKESLNKIIHPEPIIFSYLSLTVLVISVLVKFWMGLLNKKIGKKIESTSLLAAASDSMNDVLSTLATIFTLVMAAFSTLPIDGYIGLVVSLIVFKAGMGVFQDTVSPLLGRAPDPELVKEIYHYVMSFKSVIGVHDMIVHDYGPSRLFVSLHAEVPSDRDFIEIHDEIDLIERNMLKKFHALTTIHMDPVDINDELTNDLRQKTKKLISSINQDYTIHDFRIVHGPTHTNLIFDIVLPAEDHTNEKVLKQTIENEVKKWDENYFTVIQIDRSFI